MSRHRKAMLAAFLIGATTGGLWLLLSVVHL